MCGIAGLIGEASLEVRRRVERMIAAQRHRGPDDCGLFSDDSRPDRSVALGHCRLAILDLSPLAAQPMTDPTGRYTLVYNGEVFNFREVREQLAKEAGTKFVSTGDTEVVLKALIHWGAEAPKRFNGFFALALWDARDRTLLLCRDRLGIKPLYYLHTPTIFAFASELRAFVQSGVVEPAVEPRAVDGYLAFGAVQEPWTILQGVLELSAGSVARWDADDDRWSQRRYWENPFTAGPAIEPDLSEIERLYVDSVRRRLISDVPLGAFLSGGVDSSICAGAAARLLDRPLKTFCMDFDDPAFSEGKYAEAVARRFHADHHRYLFTEDMLFESLPEALEALDQPTCDGVNSYFICRVARRSGVTVALSGQGGDEVFGGYPSFRQVPRSLAARRAPRALRRLAGRAVAAVDASVRGRKLAELLAGEIGVVESYALRRAVFWDSWRRRLLSPKTPMTTAAQWVASAAPEVADVSDPINAVSYLEQNVYLKNTLLRDMDSVSMRQSLEVRIPFLDYTLVEYMARVIGRAKTAGRLNKQLLIDACGRDLPPECIERRKQVFFFPWRRWLRGRLQPQIERTFSSQGAHRWEALHLDPVAVADCYRQFLADERRAHWTHVWQLFVLYKWHERIFPDV